MQFVKGLFRQSDTASVPAGQVPLYTHGQLTATVANRDAHYARLFAAAIPALLALPATLLTQLGIDPQTVTGVPMADDANGATYDAGELFALDIRPFTGSLTLRAKTVLVEPVTVHFKDQKTMELVGLSRTDYLLLHGLIRVVTESFNLKDSAEGLLRSLGLSTADADPAAIAANNGNRIPVDLV